MNNNQYQLAQRFRAKETKNSLSKEITLLEYAKYIHIYIFIYIYVFVVSSVVDLAHLFLFHFCHETNDCCYQLMLR
jgi:hypothetical protein